MASMRLDLPAPLGPMTAVKEWKGPLDREEGKVNESCLK